MYKDLRQTGDYTKYAKNIGWEVERVGKNYCFIKKFSIVGSVVKLQRPGKIGHKDIKILGYLAKRYRAYQIGVEPTTSEHVPLLVKFGYKISRYPSLPSKTILIDLNKNDKDLMNGMHYKTRYNIGKAKRNKLAVHRSENIKEFADLWQKNSKSWGMFLPQTSEITALFKAFDGDAKIIFAKKGKDIVAGVMAVNTKDIIYYMYAFSTPLGNKLFAPTLLVWEIINYAKEKELKLFDFGGVYDERFPLPSWIGFTRFKESFGGMVVEYPGLYVKSLLPFGLPF